MGPESSILSTSILLVLGTVFIFLRLWLGTRLMSLSARFSGVAIMGAWKELEYRNFPDPLFVPIYGVPITVLPESLKATVVEVYTYFGGLWLVKIAFVAMYFNITSHLSTKSRWILYFTAAYTMTTFGIVLLAISFWCRPFSLSWTVDLNYCAAIADNNFLYLSTIFNVTNDLLVMGVPIFVLRTLNLGPREKWAIAFLMFLGTATIAAAIARFTILHGLKDGVRGITATTIHRTELCSLVELTACLIASCLPSLRAYLDRWRSKRGEKRYTPAASCSRSAHGDNGTIGSASVSKGTRSTAFASYHDMETGKEFLNPPIELRTKNNKLGVLPDPLTPGEAPLEWAVHLRGGPDTPPDTPTIMVWETSQRTHSLV
ncbi:hypothetical protein RUND412_007008 [Rhizina undulata]